jgi:parallel beta-helix repeat protein
MRGVSYCTISENYIPGDSWGIYLDSSSNNRITNNEILQNSYGGIYLGSDSNYNTLMSNKISEAHPGIMLYFSRSNEIIENIFVNSGLSVYDSYKNTVEDNSVNGKPLVYLEDTADRTIANTDVGQVILVNCENIKVEKLYISHTTVGIRLWGSHDSVISNVTISDNNWGIQLDHSDDNTIVNNDASCNKHGYSLFLSSNNEIINNKVLGSEMGVLLMDGSSNNIITRNNIACNNFDIWLEVSDNNVIYLNNLVSDTHIWSAGTENLWNSPSKITYAYNGNTFTGYLGNYWNDYKEKYQGAKEKDNTGIWNTPYEIIEDKDNYPLVELWENYFVLKNKPPVASFTCSPEKPVVNQIITFNASNSKDPDGTITNYEWDFGDGNRGEGEVVAHSYSSTEDYTVGLTVTDNDGAKDSVSEIITVPLILPVPYVYQYGAAWCGLASTAMVLNYFGESIHYWDIADDFDLGHKEGIEQRGAMANYINEHYGPDLKAEFNSYYGSGNKEQVKDEIVSSLKSSMPVFLRIVKLKHAVVVVGYSDSEDPTFYINDPSGALLDDLGMEKGTDYSIPYNIIAKSVKWSKLQGYFQSLPVLPSFGVTTIIKGTPHPPNGSLLFGDRSAKTTTLRGVHEESYTWLNDGLKGKESEGKEHPINDYNTVVGNLQFEFYLTNQRSTLQNYTVKITDFDVTEIEESFLIKPREGDTFSKPLLLTEGDHLIYIKLFDSQHEGPIDVIGPIALRKVKRDLIITDIDCMYGNVAYKIGNQGDAEIDGDYERWLYINGEEYRHDIQDIKLNKQEEKVIFWFDSSFESSTEITDVNISVKWNGKVHCREEIWSEKDVREILENRKKYLEDIGVKNITDDLPDIEYPAGCQDEEGKLVPCYKWMEDKLLVPANYAQDATAILYLYGQFVEDKWYFENMEHDCPEDRQFWGKYSEKCAMKEGWAHFFSCLARDSSRYYDTEDPLSRDFEEPFAYLRSTPGWNEENNDRCEAIIAAIFWDLNDSYVTMEDFDEIQIPAGELVSLIKDSMNRTSEGLKTFYINFNAQYEGTDLPEKFDKLLKEYNIDYSNLKSKSIKASLSCPANLHAYDSQGNHVGVNATGGIDLQILNSHYTGPDAEP